MSKLPKGIKTRPSKLDLYERLLTMGQTHYQVSFPSGVVKGTQARRWRVVLWTISARGDVWEVEDPLPGRSWSTRHAARTAWAKHVHRMRRPILDKSLRRRIKGKIRRLFW